MPQTTTRNKTRKRQTQRRRANREHEVRRAMRAKNNRSAKEVRRSAGRARVSEMPEEQAKRRAGGRVGESFAIAVSPTGTKHFPLKARVPRVARSRAKSPSIGRQKKK